MLAVNVLLQWLAAHPGYASQDPGHASREELTARTQFWTVAADVMRAVQASLLTEGLEAAATGAAAGAGVGRVAGGGAKGQRQLLIRTAGAGAATGAEGGGAAAGGLGRSGLGGDLEEGGCLPEELELLGFEPLRSKHHWQVRRWGSGALSGNVELDLSICG